MRDWLLTFFKTLELLVPPPANCHHILMFAQYGSSSEGYADKLAVQVNIAGAHQCFFIDDDDLADGPGILASELARCALGSLPVGTQISSEAGTFTPIQHHSV